MAAKEGWMDREETLRYRRVLHGVEEPSDHVTTTALLEMTASLKSPSPQTRLAWEKQLSAFLEHGGLVYPSSATREHALAYRNHLLKLVSPATAKTRLAYLSGLFSVLAEQRGEETHAFTGVAKRIKTTRPVKPWLGEDPPEASAQQSVLVELFLQLFGAADHSTTGADAIRREEAADVVDQALRVREDFQELAALALELLNLPLQNCLHLENFQQGIFQCAGVGVELGRRFRPEVLEHLQRFVADRAEEGVVGGGHSS